MDDEAAPAWQAIDGQDGPGPRRSSSPSPQPRRRRPVEVATFYLDRCAVTNRQFQRFVQAGGYDAPGDLAPGGLAEPDAVHRPDRPARPARLGATASSPPGKAEHPVVGVCWYEAVAYARGSASGSPPPPSGKRPAAGPSNSAAAPATAIPGATSSTPPAPTSGPARRRPDRPGPRFPQGRHAQRHLPDDRQRLGMARRPPRNHPLPARRGLRARPARPPDRRRRL